MGLSIGSFTSVSLDPPLVGFLPARASQSWPRIRAIGRFCVNVLSDDQEELARLFAAPHDDRFDTVKWRPAPYSGAPLLDGVAAWVDCAIESVIPAGDHVFVLGRVHELGRGKRRTAGLPPGLLPVALRLTRRGGAHHQPHDSLPSHVVHPYPGQSPTLNLHTKYSWMAFLLAMFKPVATINGHQMELRWGDNPIPLQPGVYDVQVHTKYLWDIGKARIQVDNRHGGQRRRVLRGTRDRVRRRARSTTSRSSRRTRC